MTVRTLTSAHNLRSDRIVALLAMTLGLAPVAIPTCVLLGVSAVRQATASTRTSDAGGSEADRLNIAAPLGAKFSARAAPNPVFDRFAASVFNARENVMPGASAIRPTVFVAPSGSIAKPAADPMDETAVPSHWVMEHFSSVEVLSGLAFRAGAQIIRLSGLRAPAADSQCRRLDGVVQSCLTRANGRFAVLVEHRAVDCQVFKDPRTDEMRGRCKAGKIDIAQDLIRNGLASRG